MYKALTPNFKESICNGGYGDIYKCKENNNIVVKLTEKNTGECNKKIFKKLNHPNILKIFDVDHKYGNISVIYMENIDGINLNNYISNNNQYDVNNIFKQLLDGLVYLHKNKITHRDLKFSNILITKDNIIKIVDFGLSHYGLPCKGIVGTSGYFAPEMIYSQNNYDSRCDIWSLGCILYFMVSKYFPFYDFYNRENYVKQIMNKTYILYDYDEWRKYPYLSKLCKKMLIYDYKNRYTSYECLDLLNKSN